MSRQEMICLCGFLALLLLGLGLPAGVMADGPSQAGLVIDYGDGQVEALCIEFEGEQISGSDFLALSQLRVLLDPSGSMGITICQIEGVGCPFPAKACFCQCMGGECAYWNYYYRDPGGEGWIYSPLGAGLRKVKPDAVEAWVWGDGTIPPAAELTYESICQPATPTPTQPPPTVAAPETVLPPTTTPVGTPEAAAAPAQAATMVPTDIPSEAPTPEPSATVSVPLPTPEPTADVGSALVSYWPFGLAVLGLVAAGLVVRWRRT